MSNVFTLESLREEADKEFAPVKIQLDDGTQIVLKNLLRLPKKSRESVLSKLKELNEHESKSADGEGDSATTEELDRLVNYATDILTLASDNGRKLVHELNGDLGLIMQVLTKWMGSTQPGEAQSSPA